MKPQWKTFDAEGCANSLIGAVVAVHSQRADDFNRTYGAQGLSATETFNVTADVTKLPSEVRTLTFRNAAGASASGDARYFKVTGMAPRTPAA